MYYIVGVVRNLGSEYQVLPQLARHIDD